MEIQWQFVFLVPFSTLMGNCGGFNGEIALEIDLVPFMTSRDNPCRVSCAHGHIMAETWKTTV